jgi:hypothetical protein
VQAQALYTVPGQYKISTSGLTPNLYMTVDTGSGNIIWSEELSGDSELQVFTINDHRTPASAGLVEITGNITGLGAITLCTGDDSAHPVQSLIARPGDPVSVEVGSGIYTGLDQFQRRKATVGPDGLALPGSEGGVNPPDGNNALFLRNTIGTNSRYGVVPSAAGEVVQFDGGGIDVLQFHLVAALSNEKFDTSSIFISNPVNNQLSIKGLTSNVNKVSLYTLLGSTVLSKSVSGQSSLNVDVSSLAAGMYIVKLEGANGTFSKKIIKQ